MILFVIKLDPKSSITLPNYLHLSQLQSQHLILNQIISWIKTYLKIGLRQKDQQRLPALVLQTYCDQNIQLQSVVFYKDLSDTEVIKCYAQTFSEISADYCHCLQPHTDTLTRHLYLRHLIQANQAFTECQLSKMWTVSHPTPKDLLIYFEVQNFKATKV